jgi:hypothetical protein
MDEPVEDGVGIGRVADLVVPALDGPWVDKLVKAR